MRAGIIWVLFFLSGALSVSADNLDNVSRVSITSGPVVVRAGGVVPVALRFEMKPGWHTYAENPGDSGMPPQITLKSDKGFRLASWQFPPAKTFVDAAGTTYGYENEVVITNTLQLPPSLPVGDTVSLKLDVVWMVCKEACVPLDHELELTLQVGSQPGDKETAAWKRLIEKGGWSAGRQPEQREPNAGSVKSFMKRMEAGNR
jgi:DsbC/DsbD-like thiol-disulfide interchange protein